MKAMDESSVVSLKSRRRRITGFGGMNHIKGYKKLFSQQAVRRFIELLNSQKVECLIVGAYNLALHSVPRFTGDIDIFIKVSRENAARLEKVIQVFGFGSTGLRAEDFLKPNQVIQLEGLRLIESIF